MQSPFLRPKLTKVLEIALPEDTYQHQIRVRNNMLIAQCVQNGKWIDIFDALLCYV